VIKTGAIRQATLSDKSSIIRLAIAEAEQFSSLYVDREKINALVIQGISSRSNFLWVSESRGKVDGALGAISHDGTWFERQQLSILLLSGNNSISLLQELMRWRSGRRAIKVVSVAFPVIDERTSRALEYVGIRAEGKNHVVY